MTYQPGDVVLLPFPFRDRLAERARPAVVLSTSDDNRHGDVIVAAVTPHPVRTSLDVHWSDWQAANPKIPSTVRMLLATVTQARILHHLGALGRADWQAVQSRLSAALAVT